MLPSSSSRIQEVSVLLSAASANGQVSWEPRASVPRPLASAFLRYRSCGAELGPCSPGPTGQNVPPVNLRSGNLPVGVRNALSLEPARGSRRFAGTGRGNEVVTPAVVERRRADC
jgi:hypothetical protein